MTKWRTESLFETNHDYPPADFVFGEFKEWFCTQRWVENVTQDIHSLASAFLDNLDDHKYKGYSVSVCYTEGVGGMIYFGTSSENWRYRNSNSNNIEEMVNDYRDSLNILSHDQWKKEFEEEISAYYDMDRNSR